MLKQVEKLKHLYLANKGHDMLLLSEQAELHDYKVLTETKDQGSGKWSVTIECPLQTLDKINNNGRIYPTSLMKPEIDKIKPKMKMRHLVGEYGHPIDDAGASRNPEEAIKRIATIQPSMISHVIEDMWLDGNMLMGRISTTHTKYGTEMTNLIVLDKVTMGFSLRSLGGVETRNNVDVVSKDKFVFITYDAVINPSNRLAIYDPNVKGVPQIMNESTDYTKNKAGVYVPDDIISMGTQVCVDGSCMLQETTGIDNVPETLQKGLLENYFKETIKKITF